METAPKILELAQPNNNEKEKLISSIKEETNCLLENSPKDTSNSVFDDENNEQAHLLTKVGINNSNNHVTHTSSLKLFKSIAVHAIPLAIDNIVFAAGGFGNGVIVAKLGQDVVAASAYVYPIRNVVLFPTQAILYALQPLFGMQFVENNTKAIENLFRRSMLLSGLISLPTAGALLFVEPFLKMLGQNETHAAIAGKYFRYYSLGFPASIATWGLFQLFVSTNNEYLLIPASIIRAGLELTLNYGLINLAKLDVSGWGITAVIQPWLSLGIFLAYMKLSKRFDKYHFFKFKLSKHDVNQVLSTLKEILKTGIPIGIQVACGLSSGLINSLMLGRKSSAALTAYYISWQYMNWLIMLVDSLSTTSSVLISHAIGKGLYLDPKRIGWIALGLGLSITSIPMSLFTTIQRPLASIFLNKDDNNESILTYANLMLPITGLSTIALANSFIASGMLRGHKKTITPMIANITGTLILGISLSLFLAFILDRDATSIALSECLGMFVAAIITLSVAIWTSLNFEKKYKFLNKLPPINPENSIQSETEIHSKKVSDSEDTSSFQINSHIVNLEQKLNVNESTTLFFKKSNNNSNETDINKVSLYGNQTEFNNDKINKSASRFNCIIC